MSVGSCVLRGTPVTCWFVGREGGRGQAGGGAAGTGARDQGAGHQRDGGEGGRLEYVHVSEHLCAERQTCKPSSTNFACRQLGRAERHSMGGIEVKGQVLDVLMCASVMCVERKRAALFPHQFACARARVM